MKKIFLPILACAALWTATSCSGGSASQGLSGAGATFPLPFYNIVFEQYAAEKGAAVAYGGIGSGGGVRNLRDKIVDFTGTDAFLTDKELAEMDSVIHVPTCMGAVVLAYNIKGVEHLNLSGEMVAAIFAGEVTRWNDSALVALNPEVRLPDEPIIPVYRSDGSGTTFVFTDYLSKVSPRWAENIGTGKSVNFPVGQAAKGNPGVAGVVSHTPNTIGYIGSEYAFAQKIPYASIENRHGEFIGPSSASITAAASGEMPSDTRVSITHSEAVGAYPISCFTWLVIYKEQNYSDRTREQSAATIDMVQYILSDEMQEFAPEVHYAPVPERVRALSLDNLKTVTYNGEVLLQQL